MCVVQHSVADFWQRSAWWSAGYAIRCCQEWRDRKRGRWGGVGCLLVMGGEGEGGWECSEEKIDLSPAAKSHCMSLSGGEHYSQSLWINLTAAPHDLSACPQTNYLIHKQCMMGEPQEHSILNLPVSRRCLRICFARRMLLIGWGDPYLMGYLSTVTFR